MCRTCNQVLRQDSSESESKSFHSLSTMLSLISHSPICVRSQAYRQIYLKIQYSHYSSSSPFLHLPVSEPSNSFVLLQSFTVLPCSPNPVQLIQFKHPEDFFEFNFPYQVRLGCFDCFHCRSHFRHPGHHQGCLRLRPMLSTILPYEPSIVLHSYYLG